MIVTDESDYQMKHELIYHEKIDLLRRSVLW